jgi:predicted PurR-regulated permease PerM
MNVRQPNWTRILTILLVILASLFLLYALLLVLGRFRQAVLIFVLGAIFAYILMPLVNVLQSVFRVRWFAVILAYSLVAIGMFALAVMLFTPFVQQSRSLVDNLQFPESSSLAAIARVEVDTAALETSIRNQRIVLRSSIQLKPEQIQSELVFITHVQTELRAIMSGTVFGISHTPRIVGPTPIDRQPPSPPPQTRVPPSYVALIDVPLRKLFSDYQQATLDPTNVDTTILAQALTDSVRTSAGARQMYRIMSTTPIALIRSQTWLDQHSIQIDLHDKFGQAARQVSSQGTNLLDNAITILSDTANALLNIILIIIVSIYLLNDGPRLVKHARELVPEQYRSQASFFLASLDKVLGGYIRGQLFLSLLAGILGGGGAAVLGVPYPLLIGIVTFLLQTVPVIGPMVALVPAVAVSLFFMPVLTTVALAVWYIIFQQLVTNILGPRVMGAAVGIHPLEALLAVMVGYPLGGFLGAFLAVPVMGILHILIREAYYDFVLRPAIPALESMSGPEPLPLADTKTG